jgi:dTDP-4-dehydrorhamnose reductase
MVTNNDFIILSDLEGKDYEKYCDSDCKNKNIYILGDITDSTYIDRKNTKTCTKFNIKNLQAIKENPNIKVIFGNRDLSKIHLKLGLKLKFIGNESTQENILVVINRFNLGDTSNFKSDFELLDKNKSLWEWAFDAKYFNTFGADGYQPLNTGNKQNFYDRLKFILFEYGIKDEFIMDLITEFITDLSDKFINIELELNVDNKNFCAFIAISILYSMMCEKNDNNKLYYKGLLYDLFLNRKNNFVKLINNKFLLSHGGITKYFFAFCRELENKEEEIFKNLSSFITKQLSFKESNRKVADFENITIDENELNLTLNDMKKYIILYNNFMKTQLEYVLNFNEDQLTDDIILSMFIIRFTASEVKHLTPFNNRLSSIGPGLLEIMKYIKDYYFDFELPKDIDTLFQIMGHKPVSCACSYFKHEKQIYINIDTSNSFTNTNYTTNNCSSNSKIIIENNKIKCESQVNFNTQPGQIIKLNFDEIYQIIPYNPPQNIKPLSIYSDTQSKYEDNNVITCDEDQMKNENQNSFHIDGIYYFIHGFNINRNKYLISMVYKYSYVLAFIDISEYHELIAYHKKIKEEIAYIKEEIAYIKAKKDKTEVVTNKYISLKYRQKYLKYKQKYLIQKTQNNNTILKGGIPETATTIESYKIIILTGGTGTLGKSILEKYEGVTNVIIYYTTRDCSKLTDHKDSRICIKSDLSTIKGTNEFIEEIKKIYEKFNKSEFIIINSAADKDSSIVKSTYKNIFNIPNKDDNNVEVNLFNHWTINVVRQLAEFSNEKKNVKFIHISTVYVNKEKTPDEGWGDNLIDFNKNLEKFPIIELKDNYLYGANKALAEWIAKKYNKKTIIVRLPVLIDAQLKELKETSPSKVLSEMINKFLQSEKEISLSNTQHRYPVSVQHVAEQLAEIIKENPTDKIINLPGEGMMTGVNDKQVSITKFNIGEKFKSLNKDFFKDIEIKEIPKEEDIKKLKGLPLSEKMIANTHIMPYTVKNFDKDFGISLNKAKKICDEIQIIKSIDKNIKLEI